MSKFFSCFSLKALKFTSEFTHGTQSRNFPNRRKTSLSPVLLFLYIWLKQKASPFYFSKRIILLIYRHSLPGETYAKAVCFCCRLVAANFNSIFQPNFRTVTIKFLSRISKCRPKKSIMANYYKSFVDWSQFTSVQ